MMRRTFQSTNFSSNTKPKSVLNTESTCSSTSRRSMNSIRRSRKKSQSSTSGKRWAGLALVPSWTHSEWFRKFTFWTSYLYNRYPHCVSIRFWKTYCEDEGVRAICQFLELGKPTLFLELLDNRITHLGCEFISRALHPKMNPTIQVLKLDHN